VRTERLLLAALAKAVYRKWRITHHIDRSGGENRGPRQIARSGFGLSPVVRSDAAEFFHFLAGRRRKDSAVPRAFELGGELVENRLQLLEINGFDQVIIESGFFGAANIALGPEAGERDGLDSPVCPRSCGYFVTTSVG
jgi:hypothetical protein